ncbi:GtrA family protein [Photobacterium japonica]|uniref:GtrA family protein n=1 Tax=Photobacterium japonica TaxID=2910235 RepID=UPI003D0C82D9
MKRLIRFSVVGGCGFVVDVCALWVFSQWWPFAVARVGAFWLAASSNWWLNRHVTFHSAVKAPPRQQWMQFVVASCVGFVPNVGCYWVLMQWVTPLVMTMATESSLWMMCWPYVGMVPGILLGMVINFTLADRWVFRTARA